MPQMCEWNVNMLNSDFPLHRFISLSQNSSFLPPPPSLIKNRALDYAPCLGETAKSFQIFPLCRCARQIVDRTAQHSTAQRWADAIEMGEPQESGRRPAWSRWRYTLLGNAQAAETSLFSFHSRDVINYSDSRPCESGSAPNTMNAACARKEKKNKRKNPLDFVLQSMAPIW